MDDAIVSRLRQIDWYWAPDDLAAQQEIERRIVKAARDLALVTYSDVVVGIDFVLPTVNDGRPYRIDVHNWTNLDRGLLGDFLGYTSSRSYQRAGFMISALVVGQDEYRPSWHFFDWMERLQVLPNHEEQTVLAFWADQVNRAHQWFQSHRYL